MTEPRRFRLDVVDRDHEPVPSTGCGLRAVGHGPRRRACRSAHPQVELAAREQPERRAPVLRLGEPEVRQVEVGRGSNVVDQVSDFDRHPPRIREAPFLMCAGPFGDGWRLRCSPESADASDSSHRRGVAGMSSEIEEIAHADDAALARLARLIEPGSLLEATPECLVVAHDDGRIVFANHHVEALTGFSREDLVGKPVDLLARERHPRPPGRHPPGDRVHRSRGSRDPRRGARRLDRGSRAVPGRHAPRHDRAPGRPRGAVRGGGQVPDARGADPRGGVPGSGRREQGQHLRQPAGHRPARDRAGGLAGGSVLLAPPRPRRRHRPRLAGVRGRLPDPRPVEPRVPDGARGRHDQVGDGAGVPDRRRRRRTRG